MNVSGLICPQCGTAVRDGRSAVVCCDRVLLHVNRVTPDFKLPGTPEPDVVALCHPDYALDRVIGEGQTAVVVAALHIPLQRRVALKISKGTGELDRVLLATSATKIAHLKSPAIPTIYSVDRFADVRTKSWHRVLVMELLDAVPLMQVMRDGQSDTRPVIFKNFCDAIDACHSVGLFHGDLNNPDNIMIGRNSSVHLIDFAVSTPLVESLSEVDLHERFRRADVEAVVALARRVLPVSGPIVLDASDSVVTAQVKVEKAVGDIPTARHAVLSPASRQRYYALNKPTARSFYVLKRQDIRLTCRRGSGIEYAIDMEILPMTALTSMTEDYYVDQNVVSESLDFRAYRLSGGQRLPLATSADVKTKRDEDTFIRFLISFDPALRLSLPENILVGYGIPPNGDKYEDFAYARDVIEFTEEMSIEIAFSDGDWIEPWRLRVCDDLTAEHPTYTESLGELAVDRVKHIVRWRGRNLTPGMGIFIDAGRGAENRK